MAYPIAVRHPKFHHGSGIVCSRCEHLFNYRSSKVWHRLPSFHLSGQAWKALKDENRVSRSYLAVTRKFSIPLPSREIQPKSHPPSRQKVYTSSRGYYSTLHSQSPSSGCQRKSLHGFKISFSLESFLGRTQLNARGPQTTVFHFNVFPTNEVLRKNA